MNVLGEVVRRPLGSKVLGWPLQAKWDGPKFVCVDAYSRDEYVQELRLEVRYSVERGDSGGEMHEKALRHMDERLYGEIRRQLDRIDFAVCQRDGEAARRLISELRRGLELK